MAFPARGHDRTLLERSIEDILFHFPYLIDQRLRASEICEKELTLEDATRPDMTFIHKGEVIIVELKKGTVDESALNQLLRYLKKAHQQYGPTVKVSGMLIGSQIEAEPRLRAVIDQTGYEITLKVYGSDVPTTIKICRKCRKAMSTRDAPCPIDGCNEFIY